MRDETQNLPIRLKPPERFPWLPGALLLLLAGSAAINIGLNATPTRWGLSLAILGSIASFVAAFPIAIHFGIRVCQWKAAHFARKSSFLSERAMQWHERALYLRSIGKGLKNLQSLIFAKLRDR